MGAAQHGGGQPWLTGVGYNPLIAVEHWQHGVSRMPQARRSRLSLIRRDDCAIPVSGHLSGGLFVVLLFHFPSPENFLPLGA